MTDSEAYYQNSLKAWKRKVEKEMRGSMARYARLEGQFHPCLAAQGKVIAMQRRVIEMLNSEILADT